VEITGGLNEGDKVVVTAGAGGAGRQQAQGG